MSITVRYVPEEEIEAEAGALLAEHARKTGLRVAVPALLLDDLLQHLGLRLDLDDLCAMLGLPDVLGAIWIERRHIYIDQTLDPDERPAMRGRFNFSLAHEIGHWRLHRGYVEPRHAMHDLFGEPPAPTIICRTSRKRERIELQADAFAGCLLMPRDAVGRAWQWMMGPEPFELGSARWSRLASAAGLRRAGVGPDRRQEQDGVLELLVKPLADEFQVSAQAMRIRLERLGWVVRDPGTTEPLFGAA
jgi:Zn-dependent peptidase ImmA (M78 family)